MVPSKAPCIATRSPFFGAGDVIIVSGRRLHLRSSSVLCMVRMKTCQQSWRLRTKLQVWCSCADLRLHHDSCRWGGCGITNKGDDTGGVTPLAFGHLHTVWIRSISSFEVLGMAGLDPEAMERRISDLEDQLATVTAQVPNALRFTQMNPGARGSRANAFMQTAHASSVQLILL